MTPPQQTLSVSQAAALCGVNRNTIGAWIRSGKIRAARIGRNYAIPVEELIFFLKSTDQKIPEALGGDRLTGPSFRAIQNCWQYFRGKVSKKDCENCTVYKNRLTVCFTGKDSNALVCNGLCFECQYYKDTYFSRIQFIEQIDFPAAVYKDLYFWGGNKHWAALCAVSQKDLVGMGIENVYHPDSLGQVISSDKKRVLGNPQAPRFDDIYLQHGRHDKLKARIAFYPLFEPTGTWLLLGEIQKS
jgi:excisionase family DNA binding protein